MMQPYVFLDQVGQWLLWTLNTNPGWWRGTVVERRSLAGKLPCPALDMKLMGDHLCG